jgi:hypothetical protein
MKELDGFVVEDGRGFYRPVGYVAFDEVIALVSAAIEAARRNHVRDLIVDTTALTLIRSPRTIQRYLAAVTWSDEAKGDVRLAIIAKEEMIDPRECGETGKIGVRVATKRGLVSDIFTTEAVARAWLDAQRH